MAAEEVPSSQCWGSFVDATRGGRWYRESWQEATHACMHGREGYCMHGCGWMAIHGALGEHTLLPPLPHVALCCHLRYMNVNPTLFLSGLPIDLRCSYILHHLLGVVLKSRHPIKKYSKNIKMYINHTSGDDMSSLKCTFLNNLERGMLAYPNRVQRANV